MEDQIKFHELQFRSSGYDVSDAVYCKIREKVKAEYLMAGVRYATANFSQPQLVVSILGGTDMRETLIQREAICRTVTKLTKLARCYLITSGINAGVVRSIAEEIKSRESASFGLDIPLLGICTYKDIKKPELWAKYTDEDTLIYDICVGDSANANDLNAFHDCFILVDNSYEGDYRNEVYLRAALEQEVQNTRKTDLFEDKHEHEHEPEPEDMSDDFIPVAYILIGGDLRALEMCAIAVHNEHPVCVVSGTGGAAEIISTLLQNHDEISVEYIEQVLKDEFQLKKKKYKGLVERYMEMIQQIIALRDQIKIINVRSSNGFVDEIFESLLTVHGKEIDLEYKLRFLWGRIDTRKLSEDIINLVSKRKTHRSSLDYLIKCAYIKGLKDIIYTLIRNGTMTFIEALEKAISYEVARESPATLDMVDFLLDNAGPKLRLFTTEDRFKSMYRAEKWQDLTMAEAGGRLAKIMEFGYKNPYEEVTIYDTVESLYAAGKDTSDPYRNLFIWAIITCKLELSFLFWKRTKTPLVAALVGYKVLIYYTNKGESDIMNSAKLEQCEELAQKYKQIAYQIVDTAYDTDKSGTIFMLLRELPDWGDISCFSIIMLTKNMHEFISHDSYVIALRCIWSGELFEEAEYDYTPSILMMLASVLPIPFLLILQSLSYTRYYNFYALKEHSQPNLNKIQPDEISVQPPTTSCGRSCEMCVRMWRFYNIPKVKYMLNFISYMIFLALYGVFITLSFRNRTSLIEIITAVWVLALAVEEFNQITWEPKSTFCGKARKWLSDIWNILDFAAILVFIVAFVMHFIPVLIEVSRILYCVDLIVFSIRCLQVISPSKIHGPKLTMIRKLLGDLISFLVILLVFLIAFGIASHAIMYPNDIQGISAVTSILLVPYWRLFGDLSVDEKEKIIKCPFRNINSSNLNHTSYSHYDCTAVETVVNILLIIYLLIAIILLLNLLIAILNKRYDDLEGDAKRIWAQQYTSLVREYVFRLPFVPPLNLVYAVLTIISKLLCCKLKNLLYIASDEDFANSLKLPIINRSLLPDDILPDIEDDLKRKLMNNNSINGQSTTLGRLKKYWKVADDNCSSLMKFQDRKSTERFDQQEKELLKLKTDMRSLKQDNMEMKKLLYSILNCVQSLNVQKIEHTSQYSKSINNNFLKKR